MEASLTCAVVGAAVGRVFSVVIDLGECVGDLKKKIKEAVPGLVYFDADLLDLYLASDGSRWLNEQDADIKALTINAVPNHIRGLMQEHLQLDVTCNLNNDEYFGTSFEPMDGDIHVLVELPEDPDECARYYGRRQRARDDSVFEWDSPWLYLRSWFTDDRAMKTEKVD